MDAVPIQDASIRAPWTRIKMLLAVVKSPTSDNNFAPPVASRAVSWYPIPLPSIFFLNVIFSHPALVYHIFHFWTLNWNVTYFLNFYQRPQEDCTVYWRDHIRGLERQSSSLSKICTRLCHLWSNLPPIQRLLLAANEIVNRARSRKRFLVNRRSTQSRNDEGNDITHERKSATITKFDGSRSYY